jgi:acyl-CoA thioester hydrolase
MTAFEYTFIVGWAQVDTNGHLRNTAFIDLAVDTRIMYLTSQGFGVPELTRHAMGPVVRRDDMEYFREFRLLEPIRITLQMGGLSDDGSRFIMVNECFKPDGRLGARLRSYGGWLDLNARALMAPPAEMLAALQSLVRTDDFVVLDSSVKRRS